MKKQTYRIRRRDKRNWTIERFQEGGQTIERGKFAGQLTKEGWDEINPIGYYPHLRNAAADLLNTLVGEEWPTEGWTGQDVQDAFNRAEARVLQAVADAKIEDESPTTLANPAAEFTPEQVQSIRDAADPVKAYLKVTGGKRFKRTSDENRRKLEPKEAVLERINSL